MDGLSYVFASSFFFLCEQSCRILPIVLNLGQYLRKLVGVDREGRECDCMQHCAYYARID